MILLSGHSLTQARKIPLESLSLRLSERESTASMVPVTMDGIGTDSWLVDDTEPGRGIVWRVRSIQTAYATNTPTVQLEHVISCLKDRILFGSYGPSDMGGHDTATAEQAIRFILKRQSDWRLGKCEYNFSAPYKFDGENLYDALAKVTETLDESWWDLDTSVYPFVINVIKKPSGTACELRPGRNLSAISRTIDTSGMYTRFYPVGDDDLHIKTEYIGKNESTYGIREKVEVDQALTTQAELTSWAREKLRKHAQPVVNITAEGVELAAATGESLDKLTLGRKCRVPLQEFGTIIEERITQLEYSDKVREPEKVRITMSNARTDRDILHLLADELKNGGGTGGKGARTRTKKSKEDHAWFEDTDKHVAMVAKGIIGTDASGKPNWERLSRLEVNEDGIYGEVKTVQNGLVLANTRIDQTEDHITLEANKFAEGQAALSARITVEADKISTEVANKTDRLNSKIEQTATSIRTEVNNKTAGLHSEIVQTATQIRGEVSNTAEELQASIDIQANRIGLVVEGTGANAKIRPAQIVASINNATKTSSVLISADRVQLSGLTTIDDVMTVANNYVHINAPMIVSSGGSGQDLMYVNGTLYVNTLAANSVEVPYHLSSRRTLNVADAQVSGNTLTITYVDGTTANFSKAASISGSWSGTKYTVTANPGGLKKTIGFDSSCNEYLVLSGVAGSETITGTTITKKVNVQTQDNSTTPPTFVTRATANILVDGTAVYNSGFDANHTLIIADANSTPQSSISLNPGDSMDIWAGMYLSNGTSLKWGNKVTISCATQTVSIETVSRGWSDYSGQLPSDRSITIRGRDAKDTSNYSDYTLNLRLYKSGNTVYLQELVGTNWESKAMIS